MIVIPAINETSFEAVKEKVKKAAEFSEWIHIDVVDGVFAPNITWDNAGDLESIKLLNFSIPQLLNFKFEVHLMVANPEAIIDSWLRTGMVKRVIIHLEAMTDSVYLLEKCKKYNAECMLAINPGTEVERLYAHASDFKFFQILAVYPGLAGQEFKPEIINKINSLRKQVPSAIIEVDGGITPETAKLVKEAGADILISASYIWNSNNPEKAYEKLMGI